MRGSGIGGSGQRRGILLRSGRFHHVLIIFVIIVLIGELGWRMTISAPSTSLSQTTGQHLTTLTNVLERVSGEDNSDAASSTDEETQQHDNDVVKPSSHDGGEDDESQQTREKQGIKTKEGVQSIRGTEEVFDNGDPHSRTATVISFAYGYSGYLFEKFVGSLRATGYQGHILLFVDKNVNHEIISYLKKKNVTTVILQETPCTHGYNATAFLEDDLGANLICLSPYSDIKMRWSKYPLARDWLNQCKQCTGPVLITDLRDVFFQRDPFDGTKVEGLQVFEEYYKVDTTNWLTQWPIHDCYGVDTFEDPKPMLCSGTTIGTREAMIQYLDAMHKEMLYWVANKRCHIRTDADDQSIHNYLVYYKPEVLPTPLYAFQYRTGIVNTIGNRAGDIWLRDEALMEEWKKNGEPIKDNELYMTNAEGRPWLSLSLGMSDEEGFLLQLDNATRSRVTHQVDRFGQYYSIWEESKFSHQWK